MPSRLLLPILALSVVAAIASTVQLIREQNRIYPLTLATGSETGSGNDVNQSGETSLACTHRIMR